MRVLILGGSGMLGHQLLEELSKTHEARPKVTIGMPIRNGVAYVDKALDSLLGQTLRHFELFICDNASTDDTESICKGCMRKTAIGVLGARRIMQAES